MYIVHLAYQEQLIVILLEVVRSITLQFVQHIKVNYKHLPITVSMKIVIVIYNQQTKVNKRFGMDLPIYIINFIYFFSEFLFVQKGAC